MFFENRRWAVRVIEEMGLSIKSPEATELVEMIIAGAKQYKQMTRSTGVKLSQPELVLMSVAAMTDNNSALNRLVTDLGLQADEAAALLMKARSAGRSLAMNGGFHEIVSGFYDRLADRGENMA